MTPKPRIGSLFSGAGGLDLAVENVTGGATVWHSEVDAAASRVLAARWRGVPNLGDVTAVDWSVVEPVDVLCGGFPCQDVSTAGKRAGMRAGTRSGLWASMCDAIDQLRPALVVAENVRGLLSAEADCAVEPCAGCVGDGSGTHLRALGRVLGDLADLGYDARWYGLRAADVGAPHGRFRVFIAATDAERGGRDGWASDPRRGAVERTAATRPSGVATADPRGGSLAGTAAGGDGLRVAAERGHRPASDADEQGSQGRESARRRDVSAWGVAPHSDDYAAGDGREPRDARGRAGEPAQRGRRATPDTDSASGEAFSGRPGTGDARGLQPVVSGGTDWGQYAPAIRRWERVIGRPAPAPTEPGTRGGQRLSPRLTEWMMGWPAGWVCDVPGVTRNDALRICGNGVVPQQAAAALRLLLAAARSEAVA